MKLSFIRNTVETSEQFKEFQFGIKSADMGIILEILRSKMYSNPIGAICREIASNSRDANREVGKRNIPIKISIDDSIFAPGEWTISFIDDGPGISPERMAEVFVNYCASTKRENNKQTGGFGLGAKTPFAYSDNFTIVTKVDGTRYVYVAAIEENNTGKIYEVQQEPTEESNGTSIVIPIQQKDIRRFKEEIIKSTFFWKVRPEYINFHTDIPEAKRNEVCSGCFIVQDNEYFEDRYYLLIDEIPYLLDTTAVQFPVEYRYNKVAIFLTFNTGTLNIAANREAVQYDIPTVKHIQDKQKRLIETIKKQVQDKIDEAENYFHAGLILKQIMDKDDYLLHILKENKIKEFYFDDKKVVSEFKFKEIKISVVGFSSSGERYKEEVKAFHDDMKGKPIYKIQTVLTNSRDTTIRKTETSFYIIEVDKDLRRFSKLEFRGRKSFAKRMRCAIEEINELKAMGLNVVNYSDVAPTRIKNDFKKEDISGETVLSVKTIGYNNRGWRRNLKVKCDHIRYDYLDAEKHAYHIIDDNSFSQYNMTWAMFLWEEFKIRIFFVNKKYKKYFVQKGVRTFEDVKDNLDMEKSQNYSNAAYLKTVDNEIDDSIFRFMKQTILKSNPKYTDAFVVLESAWQCSKRLTTNLPDDFTTKFPANGSLVESVSKLKTAVNKYPLIKWYDKYGTKSEDVQHFDKYISLIDKEEESCLQKSDG